MVSHNMLSDIGFEQSVGNFCYVAYGPFRIVMMKDSGYINATKICSSGGKENREWARLKNSQELISVLERYKASVNTQEHFQESNLTLLDSNRMIPRLLSPPCIFLQTTNSSAEEN